MRIVLKAALCCALTLLSVTAQAGDTAEMAAWKAWLGGLGRGFAVTQGGSTTVGTAGCVPIIAVFGGCFGNNPAAPYIIPVPPVGDTYVDPYYGTPFNTQGSTGLTSNMIYRQAESEAIVTLVNLPPPAAYFGFQTYLFTREAGQYPNDGTTRTPSPDPGRYEIFGSLGSTINNVMIARQIGASPWNAGTIAFVTTSNRTLAETLKASAAAAGLDPKRIFVEAVGRNVHVGSGAAADDLLTLIRYAVGENAADHDAWNAANATNVQTFRVRGTSVGIDRYETPAYTVKQSTDESGFDAAHRELGTILWKWLGRQLSRPVVIEQMVPSERTLPEGTPYGLVGRDCIFKGTNCLGDSQDTDSYRYGLAGRLPANSMFLMVGINHTQTGNGSYVSLGIFDQATELGVAAVSQTNPAAVGFNSGALTGSAAGFLNAVGLYGAASPSLRIRLGDMYVALFARNCPAAVSAYCTVLTTDQLPLSSSVLLMQRAYLKPGTTTGANPDVMQTPYVIFRPIQ